jgi:hypothetical protein
VLAGGRQPIEDVGPRLQRMIFARDVADRLANEGCEGRGVVRFQEPTDSRHEAANVGGRPEITNDYGQGQSSRVEEHPAQQIMADRPAAALLLDQVLFDGMATKTLWRDASYELPLKGFSFGEAPSARVVSGRLQLGVRLERHGAFCRLWMAASLAPAQAPLLGVGNAADIFGFVVAGSHSNVPNRHTKWRRLGG